MLKMYSFMWTCSDLQQRVVRLSQELWACTLTAPPLQKSVFSKMSQVKAKELVCLLVSMAISTVSFSHLVYSYRLITLWISWCALFPWPIRLNEREGKKNYDIFHELNPEETVHLPSVSMVVLSVWLGLSQRVIGNESGHGRGDMGKNWQFGSLSSALSEKSSIGDPWSKDIQLAF